MAKSLLDEIGLERSNKLMREATHKAIADAHAHGLSVTADVDGVLSEIFPDGHVEPVKSTRTIARKRTRPHDRNPPQEKVEAGPRMIVFSGPNGSGKSTITDAFKLDQKFPGVYINADYIARTELGHIPDVTQRNLDAAKLAEQRRKDALANGKPFAFETVMSTPGKLALLQEAKSKDFQVELVFVTTLDADINIARVSKGWPLAATMSSRTRCASDTSAQCSFCPAPLSWPTRSTPSTTAAPNRCVWR